MTGYFPIDLYTTKLYYASTRAASLQVCKMSAFAQAHPAEPLKRRMNPIKPCLLPALRQNFANQVPETNPQHVIRNNSTLTLKYFSASVSILAQQ